MGYEIGHLWYSMDLSISLHFWFYKAASHGFYSMHLAKPGEMTCMDALMSYGVHYDFAVGVFSVKSLSTPGRLVEIFVFEGKDMAQ